MNSINFNFNILCRSSLQFCNDYQICYYIHSRKLTSIALKQFIGPWGPACLLLSWGHMYHLNTYVSHSLMSIIPVKFDPYLIMIYEKEHFHFLLAYPSKRSPAGPQCVRIDINNFYSQNTKICTHYYIECSILLDTKIIYV